MKKILFSAAIMAAILINISLLLITTLKIIMNFCRTSPEVPFVRTPAF